MSGCRDGGLRGVEGGWEVGELIVGEGAEPGGLMSGDAGIGVRVAECVVESGPVD